MSTRAVRLGPQLRVTDDPHRPPPSRRPTGPRAPASVSRGRASEEPDVGVEPDLMAGVAAHHRPAAWLREVADESPGQPSCLRASLPSFSTRATRSGWPQLRLRERRMACQAGPSIGQRLGTGEAPLGVEADGPGCHRRGRLGGAEQHLGGRAGRLHHLLLGDRLLGCHQRGLESFAAAAPGQLDRGGHHRCQSKRTQEADWAHPSLRCRLRAALPRRRIPAAPSICRQAAQASIYSAAVWP